MKVYSLIRHYSTTTKNLTIIKEAEHMRLYIQGIGKRGHSQLFKQKVIFYQRKGLLECP